MCSNAETTAAATVTNPLTDRALDLLRQVLDAEQPQNLDRESVTVTGQGPEVGIILLPHQDLGGYSLVLWFDKQHLMISWAGVTDLERHDDLDLGRLTVRMNRQEWESEDAVKAAVVAEFRRRIRVRVRKTRIRRRWQLWCAVETENAWLETYVDDVPTPDATKIGSVIEAGMTSLLGPSRPTLRWPVPLDSWHRWADPAWPSPK